MLGKRRNESDDSPPNKRPKTEKNERQREFLDSVTVLKEQYSALAPDAFKEKIFVEYALRLLDGLYNALSMSNNEECLAKIKTLLANNRQLIQGSMLCYTATPENEVTLLLCDIALWIESIASDSALSILLPGAVTESIRDNYPDLTEFQLKDILKTHISSQCGNYLLPVQCMLDIKLEEEVDEKIFNPYYDYNKDACGAILAPSELERLYQHSVTTHALREAKLNYRQLIAQDLSLYSQLIKLTDALHLNSKAVLGSEENAASGAYPAIIDFHDYYQNLDEEQKNKIPDKLKTEIEILLKLSSDVTANVNATQNIQTCLAKRRDALRVAMQGNNEQLMQIRSSGESKQALIEAQRKNFEQGRELLTKELKEGYCGIDKQPLTMAILSELGVKPSVTSIDELNDLMSLSAIELVLLLESEQHQLSKKIAQQFTSIETLVMFLIEKDCERLQAALPKIKHALFGNQIRNAQDMAACLIALEGEKFKVVCQALLGGGEPQFIKTGEDLSNVMRQLAPEQRAEVYQTVKERLPDIIKTGTDLSRVLQYLDPGQRAEVYQATKERLSDIIKTAFDFYNALERLPPEERAEACQAVKKRLPDIIKKALDLNIFLQRLAPGQRAEVYQTVKKRLPDIIKTALDLHNVLQHLTPEQCAEVCQAIKGLPDIIKTAGDFLDVLQFLAPEQCPEVYQAVKKWLPDIIKTAEDLRYVLHHLIPEQCAEVCQAIKERLTSIIKTGNDFCVVLEHLTPEQRVEVYQAVKERLPSIIKAAWDLRYVLLHLTPEQRAEVIDSIKRRLSSIMGSEAQIRALLAEYHIEPPALTSTNDDMEVDAPNALLFSYASRRGNDGQNPSRDNRQASAGAPSQSLNRPGG